MEEKDLVILSHLRKHGREVLTKISRQSGIPVSTLHDRIKSGVGGYVEKYTVVLNYDKLGFNARAYVILKVSKGNKDNLKKHLESHPNVNSLYRINNGYDFLLDCICRNLVELEQLMEGLEENYGVERREIFYIMNSLKQEEFIADPNTAELCISGS